MPTLEHHCFVELRPYYGRHGWRGTQAIDILYKPWEVRKPLDPLQDYVADFCAYSIFKSARVVDEDWEEVLNNHCSVANLAEAVLTYTRELGTAVHPYDLDC